jgi:microcompartment protein CcmK/EutM
MQEGTGARQILKREDIPVHSVIVAVVDGMDIPVTEQL